MKRNGPNLPTQSQRFNAELSYVRIYFGTDVFQNHMLDLNDLLDRNGIRTQQRLDNERNEMKSSRESCFAFWSKSKRQNGPKNQRLRGEFVHIYHEDVDDFIQDRRELRGG